MILYGKPVAEALCQGIREDIESLPGVVPTLCIVRLGEDPSVNINFSIISPLGYKVRGKKEKNLAIAQRALDQLAQVLAAGLETGETL